MHNAWCYVVTSSLALAHMRDVTHVGARPQRTETLFFHGLFGGHGPDQVGWNHQPVEIQSPRKWSCGEKTFFRPAMRQFHYYLLLDLPIKNRHSYIMVYPNFPMFLLCVSYFAQKFCMNIPWFSQVITASSWQLAQYLVADASHRRLLLSAAARSAATAAWELAEAGVRCSTVCPFFWATMVKQQIQRINIDKYLQWYWYVSLQRIMIHYNYIELLFLDCAVMSRTRCSQT